MDVEQDLANSNLGMHGTCRTGVHLGLGETMLDFVTEAGRGYMAEATR